MAKPSEFEFLKPTVIPAQPGYRTVWYGLDDDLSEETTIKDLIECREDIIAWIVRPEIALTGSQADEVIDATVYAVTPQFGVRVNDVILSPTGEWSRRGQLLRDETAAREDWLAELRREEQSEKERAEKKR